MPESASSASSTGIQAPGGSVNVNSSGIYIVALIVLGIMFFLYRRKKR